MRNRICNLSILAIGMSAVCFAAGPNPVNVCPQPDNTKAGGAYTGAVAASGTCNETFVFTNGSVSIVAGNPNPYDGTDDNLVGVVNNSTVTITSFQVSGNGIFNLETNPGDGICAFTPFISNSQPCNANGPGASNYAGSASSYTVVDSNTGTINFAAGIPPGGTGYFSLEGPPSTNTVIVAAANLTKSFTPTTIFMNGASTLSFTVTNPNSLSLSAIAFSDTLPAGVIVATPNALTGSCGGGTITATAGSGAVSLSGATLAANANCTFSVSVLGITGGTKVNTTSNVTATGPNGAAPSGSPATATLTVIPLNPPTLSKAFSPNPIAPGGVTTLTLVVTNPNSTGPVSSIAFTDNLPAGLTVATPNGLNSTCNGTATAGATSVSLSGASLAAGGTCTITVRVTAPATGSFTNLTSAITSNVGSGPAATATLGVATPPVLTKAFGLVSVLPNGSTTLSFLLTNPNSNVTLTNLTFTDTLPAALTISTPSGLGGTCAGSIIAPAGGTTLSASGITLASGASCTIILNVTGSASIVGLQTNTTSTVTSLQAPPGAPAVATINVGDPFQVSYFPNLNAGDSFIDISNTGTLGASNQSGTTASITGAICANVYTFSPDEQLVSCCSCPVTPNGLVSLSARQDLISNTLTPAVPSSIVVKLVATAPAGGTCNNSAASTPALAPGLVAWGSKLHGIGGAGGADGGGSSFGVTETPFTSSSLSAGELTRVRSLCGFIIANGSGYGICNSCRLGGLGGEKQ